MPPPAQPTRSAKHTTLHRTLTTALNEVGGDAALVAVFEREVGPLALQIARGFTARETQAILRSLSAQGLRVREGSSPENDHSEPFRLRLIIPGAKTLIALPLRYRQRPYGVLVVGNKVSQFPSKKEKIVLESAREEITTALERASLFDGILLLSRPWISEEPQQHPKEGVEVLPPSLATPDIQRVVQEILTETSQLIEFDRAWVTSYDPLVGSVEVLGMGGDLKGDPKKTLKPGQRMGLDESASGWAVRHRKSRVDHDLASTQGRFLDHKPLFKDRFCASFVAPFFLRGQVGGTIMLGSKTAGRYDLADARTIEPILLKLSNLIPSPTLPLPNYATTAHNGDTPALHPAPGTTEPFIRKQERRAALEEFSAFLATEVREPLASIRAQLEDLTGEGILDFDPQTRVESAMRDLMRVEAILNEILDFNKPLELKRRLCRPQTVLENALTLVATALESSRITVTKRFPPKLAQVRCDEGKMQRVFLSIFKNALEAMAPGGHLDLELSMQRAGRTQEVQILIKNDGVPIPAELVDKVFEPYFTTKRSGTGLGLASVKKVVEEHQGNISIASGPGQGTTLLIRLPASRRPLTHRFRGRSPHPRQPRQGS